VRKSVDVSRRSCEAVLAAGLDSPACRRDGAVPHRLIDNPPTCGLSVRSDDEVQFHVLWSWTNQTLDSLSERVAENRSLGEASDFARFVINSRLAEVLKRRSCDDALKVDGPLIEWKAKELLRTVQERWAKQDTKAHLEALQLQSIREKLDCIAGYLSKLAGPVASVPGAAEPQLRVISGGADEGVGS